MRNASDYVLLVSLQKYHFGLIFFSKRNFSFGALIEHFGLLFICNLISLVNSTQKVLHPILLLTVLFLRSTLLQLLPLLSLIGSCLEIQPFLSFLFDLLSFRLLEEYVVFIEGHSRVVIESHFPSIPGTLLVFSVILFSLPTQFDVRFLERTQGVFQVGRIQVHGLIGSSHRIPFDLGFSLGLLLGWWKSRIPHDVFHDFDLFINGVQLLMLKHLLQLIVSVLENQISLLQQSDERERFAFIQHQLLLHLLGQLLGRLVLLQKSLNLSLLLNLPEIVLPNLRLKRREFLLQNQVFCPDSA